MLSFASVMSKHGFIICNKVKKKKIQNIAAWIMQLERDSTP